MISCLCPSSKELLLLKSWLFMLIKSGIQLVILFITKHEQKWHIVFPLYRCLPKINPRIKLKHQLIIMVILVDGGLCFQVVSVTKLLYPQQNGILLYPSPQNGVLAWAYTVFSISFRQHLMILLYNFDSFCPILFKFTPHHNYQTMPVW